jgi:hypothetical protein
MLIVHLAGIMYFHGCDDAEKGVLVPDGTKGMGTIPEHNASLWVELSQLDGDDWFDGQKHTRKVKIPTKNGNVIVTVIEFRIPEYAELVFPDDTDGPADFVNLGDVLNKLESLAPGFDANCEPRDVIARIPIRGGVFEAFDFLDVAVVRWMIRKYSALKITATTRSGVTKFVALKQPVEGGQAEAVFGNTSDLLASPTKLSYRAYSEQHEHYRLYAKLLKDKMNNPPTRVEWIDRDRDIGSLPHHHDYLTAIVAGFQVPDPGCEPTCCP